MYYLLFTVYLAIGTYLVTRIPFIRKTGLSPQAIAALFIIKVFAGVAVGWMSQKYYPVNDYWNLNSDGMIEYKLMLNDPHEFFSNIFRSPYQNGYTRFFNSIGSYWNDLRYNIILKFLAFSDILSHGNYYINSLIFNFFGFFGPVALFRVYNNIYKDKKWAVLAGCFLLPSTLYFTSGVHKDLIIFTMFGLFSYALYFSLVQAFTIKRTVLIFLSIIVILFIRNFVAVALVPASIAFALCIKKRINPLTAFVATYATGFILMLAMQFLAPSFQPLKIITQKQSDFFDLPTAASEIKTTVLEPNLKSFISNLPEAFDHGFLRPYIWETKGTLLFPLALELLIYELLFLFLFFKRRLYMKIQEPFVLFAVFFAISMLLMIGYIIPNTGSIVRYKSVYLPFLVIPLLCTISFRKAEAKTLF